MKKVYKISIDCANCANKLENIAKKFNGIEDAAVNYMTQKIHINFKDEVSPDDVMPELRKACRKIHRGCDIYI